MDPQTYAHHAMAQASVWNTVRTSLPNLLTRMRVLLAGSGHATDNLLESERLSNSKPILHELRVGSEVLRRAFENDAAMPHHANAVRHLECNGQLLLHKHD